MPTRTLLAASLTVALLVPAAEAAHVAYRVVADDGWAAPVGEAGANFSDFDSANISPSGAVGFRATVVGVDGYFRPNFDDGFFSTPGDGTFRCVARDGDPAPGYPAGTVTKFYAYSTPGRPYVADDGRVLFLSDVDPVPPGEEYGSDLWMERGGAPAPVARYGAEAVGMPAGNTWSPGILTSYRLTPAGHVGVCPGINGVSYDNGLWVYGPDATVPRLVAGHGVDLPSPGAESTKYVWDWDLGPRGDVVAEIYTSEYDECLLYADPSGAASVLAHEDDPAPGLGAGLSWIGWSRPKLDATGRMAFRATVAGTGITGDNERLILRRETDGTLVRLAQEGDPAPDLADRWLGSDLRVLGINAAGDVLIQAQLRDADGSDLGDAYYRHAAATGALELLIARGFGVPGLPGTTCEVLRGVQLNDAGFVFFAADLEGPGITSVNDEALWMRAPGEAAQLVLLEDGPIELPEIGLSGIVDDMQWSGYAPNVSADGRTAVCITVSHDGSRDDILITVGAPEPATLALVGLGAACAALSRRRLGRRGRR